MAAIMQIETSSYLDYSVGIIVGTEQNFENLILVKSTGCGDRTVDAASTDLIKASKKFGAFLFWNVFAPGLNETTHQFRDSNDDKYIHL